MRDAFLAPGLPLNPSMGFHVGLWELSLSAAIGAGAAWFLDWPPALSAALGVLLVPLVAATVVGLLSGRRPHRVELPPRGLCRCGHPMSMHCHADCSGPCAVPDCRCAGEASIDPASVGAHSAS